MIMPQPEKIFIRKHKYRNDKFIVVDNDGLDGGTAKCYLLGKSKGWGIDEFPIIMVDTVEEAEKALDALSITKWFTVIDGVVREVIRELGSGSCNDRQCFCDIQTLMASGCPYQRPLREKQT